MKGKTSLSLILLFEVEAARGEIRVKENSVRLTDIKSYICMPLLQHSFLFSFSSSLGAMSILAPGRTFGHFVSQLAHFNDGQSNACQVNEQVNVKLQFRLTKVSKVMPVLR